MNVKVKLTLYIVLLVLAGIFTHGFIVNYAASTAPHAETPNPPGTNTIAITTNTAATATSSQTSISHPQQGAMIGYLAALVGSLIGLGIMVAYDVTQYMGNAAVDALLEDRGAGMRDPEYEKAEEAWANGDFLDAVNLMRDFLKKNPREQYAALRIAEIYEKDLNNPLAAALEYEEVLKKKLPAERWGWAAIHLCNLYSKLGQQEKTRDLLQRIADDYPQTAAAKKAREKLGLPEPATETPVENAPEDAPPAAPKETSRGKDEPHPPEPPKSNLPQGFRPKK